MKFRIHMIVLLLSIQTLVAQEQFGISYVISIPNNNLNKLLDGKASFRGISFEYRHFVSDQISIGGNSGWTVFNNTSPQQTYSKDGVSFNAKTWSFTHTVPIQISGRYHFSKEGGMAQPFAGLGLGTTFINQEVWIGLATIKESHWNFSFYPEAGFIIDLGGTDAIISTQYNYVVNGHFQKKGLDYWNFKFGVLF